MGAYRQAQAYSEGVAVPNVAAGTATQNNGLFAAPVKCRVVAIRGVSDIAVTGNTTNSKNLNVINRGADGSGSTEVANKDLATGVNLVAFDEFSIPLNATFVDGVPLNEGDVLAIQTEQVGTGVAIGPVRYIVDWVPA